MSHESICYTSPFIKEVIIRIDLPAAVSCLSETLHTKISKAALKKFPISEPQKPQTQEFQFSGEGFSANSKELTQWTFHGKEREKSLIISPDSIAQTNRTYKSYEIFTGDFFHVLNAVKEVQPDLVANRIGIRYVNIIEIPAGDPLEWKDYINESMLGIIDLHSDKKNISRAFHVLEYNFDPIYLKFQFGVANPDYPAVVKRKQFVLDLDAHSVGAFGLDEIQSVVEQAHALIQEFFEISITPKTRKLMKPKKEAKKND